MIFQEALQKMCEGEKVRLSDWTGYWFIPLGDFQKYKDILPIHLIHVFTKDGDVLGTPNIKRYAERDDWEIVTEALWRFDAALRFLKNNKYVQRLSWNNKKFVFMEYGGLFIFGEPDGESEQYIPSNEDLFATDWEIVF